MIKIFLISLLILMSVLMFVNRIYHQLKTQKVFSQKLLTKIGTFHYFFIFFMYIVFFSQPFWIWFYTFVSLLIFPFFIFIFTKIQQQHFYGDFLRFLSIIILKMQVGNSFQTALELALQSEKWKQQDLMKHIFENVTFTQQGKSFISGPFSGFIGRILKEFFLVQNNQHQAIDRLCKFQNNLRSEMFFSRKSRQIWIYFGFQLGLLSAIYLIILFFIIKEYGFFKFQSVFLLSFLCYFLGILSVYLLGRDKKWLI